MRFYIINGPNLNILGTRQPDLYGNRNFNDYLNELRIKYPETEILYFQSNHAGEIIDKIHEIAFNCDGIILNPAAYTHSSLAIGDAVAAINKPVIEVHITNIFSRENIRHKSVVSRFAKGVITGLGLDVYEYALLALLKMSNLKS